MLHKGKKVIALFLSAILLVGCGSTKKETIQDEGEQSPEIVSWFSGDDVVLNYEVPASRSFIVVDQLGYLPASVKKCLCQDIMEETEFEVINEKNGESVFQGVLKPTEDSLTYVGDFSDVTTPGTYYIRTEYLGESYPFEIADEVYHTQVEQLLQSLEKMDWTKNISESCMILDTLLLSYELYPDVFLTNKNSDGVPKILEVCYKGAQEILAFQNHKTGAVFDKIVNDTGDSKDGSPELTGHFVGTIAKFCFSYKEYDAKKATEMLQYASLGWQYIGKNDMNIALDSYFFACAEMYRVTGQSKYRYSIKNKLPDSGRIVSNGEYDIAYFGNITYLCTSYKVELEYCNTAIDSMIREATEITEQSKAETYFVRDSAENAILKDSATIVFASRVNYNLEYVTVVENHLHYLTGMNLDNKNYFTQKDSYVSTSDYGKSLAILAYSLLIVK